MDVHQLFLQRYNVLYNYFLAGFWENVSPDLMRQRPHPRVNSIAWNLWHITKVEDAALNRFVTNGVQVLDEGGWMQKLNLPWRHNGTGMTFAEVDELNQKIDLQALHDYSSAVYTRTCQIVNQIDADELDSVIDPDHLRKVVYDEGLAMPAEADGLFATYTGWAKARFLMNHGLTHPYQHLGEMGVITGLLGIDF
jgi:uncharacterized damage-inducible protein DinB